MKSSIGRIVHYVLPNGQHRPAIIVNCWPGSDRVNLTVFPDLANDHGTNRVESAASARLDESTAPEPGTWHWPERE